MGVGGDHGRERQSAHVARGVTDGGPTDRRDAGLAGGPASVKRAPLAGWRLEPLLRGPGSGVQGFAVDLCHFFFSRSLKKGRTKRNKKKHLKSLDNVQVGLTKAFTVSNYIDEVV